jgi:predicted HTH transcriptional regulator
LAYQTALSKRTISRGIKLLQENTKIKRIGSSRAGYWRVL